MAKRVEEGIYSVNDLVGLQDDNSDNKLQLFINNVV